MKVTVAPNALFSEEDAVHRPELSERLSIVFECVAEPGGPAGPSGMNIYEWLIDLFSECKKEDLWLLETTHGEFEFELEGKWFGIRKEPDGFGHYYNSEDDGVDIMTCNTIWFEKLMEASWHPDSRPDRSGPSTDRLLWEGTPDSLKKLFFDNVWDYRHWSWGGPVMRDGHCTKPSLVFRYEHFV